MNPLRDVPMRAQELIAAEVRRALDAHPSAAAGDFPRLAHRVWEAVRGLVYDETTGHTIGLLLSGPEFGNPTILLEELLAHTRAAGGTR